MVKQSRNFYLSEDTLEAIRALSTRLNISQAQVVEQAVEGFGREQALKDWETLRAWWKRITPESKTMLQELAALQPHQAKPEEDS